MAVMLKQCCCGCTLKTGTLIIAVVFAIVAALQVVIYSVAAVESSEAHIRVRGQWEIAEEERISGTPMPTVDEDGEPVSWNSTESTYQHSGPSFPSRMNLLLVWKWCTILLTITETVSFLLNILLMFAANKDSARHVMIWLLGFCGTTCSRLLLQLIINGSLFYLTAVIGGFVLLAVIFVLTAGAAYSLLVVLSYYRQLVGTGIARRISQQDE